MRIVHQFTAASYSATPVQPVLLLPAPQQPLLIAAPRVAGLLPASVSAPRFVVERVERIEILPGLWIDAELEPDEQAEYEREIAEANAEIAPYLARAAAHFIRAGRFDLAQRCREVLS